MHVVADGAHKDVLSERSGADVQEDRMDAKHEEEGAERVALLLAGLGQEALEGLDTVGARLSPDEEVGRLEVELGSEVEELRELLRHLAQESEAALSGLERVRKTHCEHQKMVRLQL
jgi:hypothetical protein